MAGFVPRLCDELPDPLCARVAERASRSSVAPPDGGSCQPRPDELGTLPAWPAAVIPPNATGSVPASRTNATWEPSITSVPCGASLVREQHRKSARGLRQPTQAQRALRCLIGASAEVTGSPLVSKPSNSHDVGYPENCAREGVGPTRIASPEGVESFEREALLGPQDQLSGCPHLRVSRLGATSQHGSASKGRTGSKVTETSMTPSRRGWRALCVDPAQRSSACRKCPYVRFAAWIPPGTTVAIAESRGSA